MVLSTSYAMVRGSYGFRCLVISAMVFVVYVAWQATIRGQVKQPPEQSAKQAPLTQTTPKNAIEDRFYFIPSGTDSNLCSNLFTTTRGQAFKYPASYHLTRTEFLDHLGKVLDNLKMKLMTDGHIGIYPLQAKTYYALANSSLTKTVCETGFNAGHSTLQWLTGSTAAKVYSFDIGSHPYSKLMASYLQSKFPGRLQMIWGDSFKTIPKFLESNPGVTCDLMVVDGSHSFKHAHADLNNFRKVAKPGYSVAVADDVNAPNSPVYLAWKKFSKDWLIEERFTCRFSAPSPKGFAVGRYLGYHGRSKDPRQE